MSEPEPAPPSVEPPAPPMSPDPLAATIVLNQENQDAPPEPDQESFSTPVVEAPEASASAEEAPADEPAADASAAEEQPAAKEEAAQAHVAEAPQPQETQAGESGSDAAHERSRRSPTQEVAEEAGPHLPPTRPASALDTQFPVVSPSAQPIDDEEDSFAAEVSKITNHRTIEEEPEDDYFYTRSGQPVHAADVDLVPELLNSPRFKEACQRQGIRITTDLFRRALCKFDERGVSDIKRKMRFDFFEAKRVQNAYEVLLERERVITQKHRLASTPAADSSMLAAEQHRNELKKRQMEKRNDMMEAYDCKLRRLRKERQERIEHQEMLMEKARKQAMAEYQQRDAIRHSRSELKKQETNEILEAQENAAIERGAHMEARAEANLIAVHERQEEELKEMQEKRKIAEQRIAACLETDEKLMQAKRDKYHDKQSSIKKRYENSRGDREQLKRQNESKQEQAAARRDEVKQRDEFLTDERLRKAAEREEKLREREQMMENRRELEKERKRLLDERKQAKRKEIRARDQQLVEQKRNDFFDSLDQSEKRRASYFKKRDEELEIKKEEDRLRLEEKLDYLDRHKRMKEYQRDTKLAKMMGNRKRIEDMMTDKHTLLEARKMSQKEMWDSRVRIEFVSPGPGEYNVKRIDHAPSYAFGGRHEAPRPKPEPGPGAYKVHEMMYCNGQLAPRPSVARIGKGKSKTALDWEILRASKLPGPLDYCPARPSSCPGYRMAKGKALSDLDLQLIQAAKTPGPMSYVLPEQDRGQKVGISKANPKGYLDWAIYNGKQCPGPQDYLVDANVVKHSAPKTKFSTGNAKTDVDWQMYRAAQQPGPGEYEAHIDFSSGPHGSKNSSRLRPKEARAISQVASFGATIPNLRPHSTGARATNIKAM